MLLTLPTESAVYSAAFSRDGLRVATGHWEQVLGVWDALGGRQLFTLKGHSGCVRSVAFSPDGQRILSSSDDHTAKLWDAARDPAQIILLGHTNWIWAVAFSPDGQRVATASLDHTARIWDAATGAPLITLPADIGQLAGVTFSPDGRRIAAWSDATALVYDAFSGTPLFSVKPDTGVIRLVFSSNGGRIFVVTGASVEEREASSGKVLGTLFKANRPGLQAVTVSADGQRVATVDADRRPEIWGVAAASAEKPIALNTRIAGWPYVIVFSADGKRLLTQGSEPEAKVWNALTGEELLTLKGHNGPVEGAAFFSDGRRIVTSGFDASCRVWDADTGKELLTLKRHGFDFQCVAVSPDGRRIAAGGPDNMPRIWEASSKEQVLSWANEESAAEKTLAADQHAPTHEAKSNQTQPPELGGIQQWLILAPIRLPGRTREAMLAALDQQQLPNESRLQPHADEAVEADGVKRVWKQLKLDETLLDFDRFLGGINEWSVAYAVCYIHSDREQNGLIMKVAEDDLARIFLNGTEVYRGEDEGSNNESNPDIVAEVQLQQGINTLVFKVINETGGWQGSVRFTDATGEPVKGIRLTLTPP